jgi:hypothetical protein
MFDFKLTNKIQNFTPDNTYIIIVVVNMEFDLNCGEGGGSSLTFM